MRKLFVLTVIVAALTIFTNFQTYSSENQKCDCQFIEESLKDLSRIKVGMTREELLTFVETEGGISVRTQNHYVYKKCVYIKVAVKFEPVGNKKDHTESPNDKIIEISNPYLEFAIGD